MFQALITPTELGGGEFQAPASPDKGDSLFGGQFIAQCLAAAATTTGEDRRVNSLHAYFLRPGSVDLPLSIRVETIRDGRSFSWRQTLALQNDQELFRMLISFQVPDATPEFTAFQAPSVPPPEAVDFTYDDFIQRETGEAYGVARPLECRYINPPDTAEREPVTESQRMWMRIRERLPETPAIHQAGLAYLSDASLIDHILLPHGLRWQDDDFLGTSLDHAMWFHRFARADDWLLFDQEPVTTGGGRGLARGHFFDRGGQLIATCVQEGLMRWTTNEHAV